MTVSASEVKDKVEGFLRNKRMINVENLAMNIEEEQDLVIDVLLSLEEDGLIRFGKSKSECGSSCSSCSSCGDSDCESDKIEITASSIVVSMIMDVVN